MNEQLKYDTEGNVMRPYDITDEQISKSLTFLSNTDEELGPLCGHLEFLHHQLKVKKAIAFLDAEGTVGERQAHADSSLLVRKLIGDIGNATADKETLKAKRKTRELTVEVWRTQSSNRRSGNV
jgi:hypothetical protein